MSPGRTFTPVQPPSSAQVNVSIVLTAGNSANLRGTSDPFSDDETTLRIIQVAPPTDSNRATSASLPGRRRRWRSGRGEAGVSGSRTRGGQGATRTSALVTGGTCSEEIVQGTSS